MSTCPTSSPPSIELGFVSLTPAHQVEPDLVQPMRRIRPGLVRPLFGRVAGTLYAGCAALVVAIFATRAGAYPKVGRRVLPPPRPW